MIITHLTGGLGNQLFQYALGRKLALQNRDCLKLDLLDYQDLSGPLHARYKLDRFNLTAPVARTTEIARLKLPYGQLSRLWRSFNHHILRRFHIGFEPSILRRRGDIYLAGYWQSEKYFSDIAETIREDLTLRRPLSPAAQVWADKIKREPFAVSLHIRRGDYLTPRNRHLFGGCDLAYYQTGQRLIAQQTQTAAMTIFVFSDDIAWAREHLSLPCILEFVSADNLPDYEELHLMSLCRHHIIANSSFSWWGAWLDPRPDKIVIAPKIWFHGTKPKIYRDIVPESWIKI